MNKLSRREQILIYILVLLMVVVVGWYFMISPAMAKNTTLKSAVYKSYGNYKTILTGNLIVIRLDQTKINPYYLKAFLDSKQGILAIKSIQTGTTIISLNPNSLKYMKIPLIDFTLQKEIANKYKDNIVLIKQLQKEYEEAINYSCKIFEHYMEE